MTSLVVLMWMSLTSAVVHSGLTGSPAAEAWGHLAVQSSVLLAVVVEAGSVESGRASRWRRPTQALALASFVVHVVLAHPVLAGLFNG
jgi:hypothetical protein